MTSQQIIDSYRTNKLIEQVDNFHQPQLVIKRSQRANTIMHRGDLKNLQNFSPQIPINRRKQLANAQEMEFRILPFDDRSLEGRIRPATNVVVDAVSMKNKVEVPQGQQLSSKRLLLLKDAEEPLAATSFSKPILGGSDRVINMGGRRVEESNLIFDEEIRESIIFKPIPSMNFEPLMSDLHPRTILENIHRRSDLCKSFMGLKDLQISEPKQSVNFDVPLGSCQEKNDSQQLNFFKYNFPTLYQQKMKEPLEIKRKPHLHLNSSVCKSEESLNLFPFENITSTKNAVNTQNYKTKQDLLKTSVKFQGKNLNRTQKRLIQIGKAILYKPSIVLIDSSFFKVEKTFAAFSLELLRINLEKSNCTIITVDDRPSRNSICNYDSLIVMDRGRVVQQGDPTSLLEDPHGLLVRLLLTQENC
jgi:ABC-type oligopeptide transport system ATPase subunit